MARLKKMNMKNEIKWRPVTSGVLLRSILESMLFNIFVYDLGNGEECTLNQLADDVELGGVVDRPDDYLAFSRDLNRL